MHRLRFPLGACVLLVGLSLSCRALAAEVFLPAFPGAEGHGARTQGGRGGRVIAVTNLQDSGPGSLRAAIEETGPRTIVFRVSGTIDLQEDLRIREPFVTIAGQTAPGDGITLKRHPLMIEADEVIIRHLRVRLGDESGKTTDAISARYVKNVIIDHVSASWSIDETVSVYHCEDVTVQWCIISESLYQSHHTKGGSHGFGGIWGSNRGSYHHNLIAHHSSRNPRFASGSGFTDFRNNVIYNWGTQSIYGGERQQVGNPKFDFSTINVVANFFKPGPATRPGAVAHRIAEPSSRNQDADYGTWHVADNVVEGHAAVTADNWAGGVQPQDGDAFLSRVKLDQPWPAMPITPQSATDAYTAVLAHAGASLPRRDAVDLRLVEEVRSGAASFEGPAYRAKYDYPAAAPKTGIIDSQSQVGGWPELRSAAAPLDTDGDGMPDPWETRYGLDPGNPADGAQDADGDGYTNFEECLNATDPTVYVDYTGGGASLAPAASDRPRVLVTSDGEIDDECSLVRFLLYVNEWDVEGIITSSSQYHWHGHRWAGDDWAQPYLDAYAEVFPNLLKHDPRYPSPEFLRARTLLGNVKAEGEMDEVTPGSQRIVEVLLDHSDPRPIWIQAWGGTNTIARALKTIEETHPERMAEVAQKIRFYFIWEQDDTYQTYIRPHWGGFNITTIICDQFWAIAYQWNKILPADQQAYFKAAWMKANVLEDHGPLAALYQAHVPGSHGLAGDHDFTPGDFRSEGDSPAFLHTIPTGLRNLEFPDYGGWGGRFVRVRDNTWLDPVPEPGYRYPEGRWFTSTAWGRKYMRERYPADQELMHAYFEPQTRWLVAIQNDFAARADWCVQDYAGANHPPVVLLAHGEDLSARPGATVRLDAQRSRDPDGDALTCRWWQYREAGSFAGDVHIRSSDTPLASLTVPSTAAPGETIHLICEMTDHGVPRLTRYRRVIVTVSS